jgi:hypothetical protein
VKQTHVKTNIHTKRPSGEKDIALAQHYAAAAISASKKKSLTSTETGEAASMLYNQAFFSNDSPEKKPSCPTTGAGIMGALKGIESRFSISLLPAGTQQLNPQQHFPTAQHPQSSLQLDPGSFSTFPPPSQQQLSKKSKKNSNDKAKKKERELAEKMVKVDDAPINRDNCFTLTAAQLRAYCLSIKEHSGYQAPVNIHKNKVKMSQDFLLFFEQNKLDEYRHSMR